MTSTVEISDESVVEVMKAISSGTAKNGVVVPTPETRVFKDQCTYCFHTPFFAGKKKAVKNLGNLESILYFRTGYFLPI